MMIILNCDNSVCKKITIPSPSSVSDSPEITVEVTVPTGLKISDATITHGVMVANVWTIESLPAGESAVLDICFNPQDCNVPPTGKTGSVTITTLGIDPNPDNNTIAFNLEYLTCLDVNPCVSPPELFTGITAYEIETDAYTGRGIRHVDGDIEGFVGIVTEPDEGAPILLSVFNQANSVTSNVSLSVGGVSIEGVTSSIFFGIGGIVAAPTPSTGGIRYNTDHSESFTDRSLVDKEYVDSLVNSGVQRGRTIVTTDSDGIAAIPHTLGVLPTYVQLTADVDAYVSVSWSNIDSDETIISIKAFDLETGLPWPSSSIAICWEARV